MVDSIYDVFIIFALFSYIQVGHSHDVKKGIPYSYKHHFPRGHPGQPLHSSHFSLECSIF